MAHWKERGRLSISVMTVLVGCDLHIQLFYIKFVVFAISSPLTKMHKAMQNVEIEVV